MDLVYLLHFNAITAPKRRQSAAIVHRPLSTVHSHRYHGSRAMTARTAAPQATGLAASVREVSFTYGERLALDRLTLDVPSGAVFGLLGPNGSGKSTLLSLLAGLRQTSAGEVRLLGPPPSTAPRGGIV